VQTVRDKPTEHQRHRRLPGNTYDLSSREGVVLMCIAEALLRIPGYGDGRFA
jgi:proline dehydrogenase